MPTRMWASRAAEQAKDQLELASSAGDACSSLCRTGRATKRHMLWRARQESNLRPLAPEANALSD